MRWILLHAFLILSNCSFCQEPFHINYNTDHGLPSSEVYDFQLDSIGNVWFTTDRGVCKYDGYNFETYTTKDGLADNTNFEIFRDNQNRLWFNGYSGVISLFENEKFSHFSGNEALLSHMGTWNNKWIRSITQLSDGSMLFCPQPFRKGYLQILDNDSILNNTLATNLFNDSSNPPLVDTFSYQDKVLQVAKLLTKEAGFKLNLGIRSDSCTYTFGNYEVHKIRHDKTQSYKTASAIIKICTDNQSNLWVCTFDGVYFFKGGDLTLAPKLYFRNESVTSIMQDNEGNYWMSTLESGIFFIPSFQFYTIGVSEPTKTDYLTLKSFHNHLVTGNSKSEILIFDSDLRLILKERISTINKQIRNIDETKDPNLLTLENGYYLENSNGQLLLKKDANKTSYYRELSNGEFIAVDMSGLRVLTTENYLKPTTTRDFPGRIKKVTQDSNQTVWIASLKGLFKIDDYDYENWKEVKNEGTSFGRINDIIIDKSNHIWLASIGYGLFFLHNNHIIKIDTDNGLPSNIVNTIFLENDSTLLIGTNSGISSLNYHLTHGKLEYQFNYHANQKNGLISNYINDIDTWNDDIFVATNNGICFFNPRDFNRSYTPTPIFINKISVNDSLLEKRVNYTFNHNLNDIFIHYTGISYRKDKNVPFYRYRLKRDNIFSDWYYTDDRSIRYNDLQPNDYVFEVSAINNAGKWNDNPASISFTIKPNITQTTWFKIGLWLTSLALIVSLFTYQNKQVKRRAKEKRKMQEAEIRVQEAEINALRNQMNPHFIFNSLNSIQNFIFKKDVEKANYYLSKFSSLIRDSLQLSRLEFISAREEINFLKNYIELEQMRFHDKFDFNIKLDDDVDTNSLMIPSLLLQPILENAVKHAFKSIAYKGEINIHFFLANSEQLGITIHDNGNGLSNRRDETNSANKKRRSLGIEIIKSRIALLNDANHAHKAKIKFIDHTSTNDNELGLEVRFLLPIVYRNDKNINHRRRNQ